MGIKVYKKKIKLTKLIKALVVVVVTVLILVGITESIVAEISQRTKKISGLSIVNSKSWREREETGYSLNVAVKVRNVNLFIINSFALPLLTLIHVHYAKSVLGLQ